MLRRLDEALATGYLASRIIESAVMMAGIVAALLLIPVSEQFLAAGAPQGSWFQTLGAVLLQAKLLGLTLLSLPLLGLGGLLFTWLLFRFRLVPRVIAVVGLLGYGLMIPAGIAGHYVVFCRWPEGGDRSFVALVVNAGIPGFTVSGKINVKPMAFAVSGVDENRPTSAKTHEKA